MSASATHAPCRQVTRDLVAEALGGAGHHGDFSRRAAAAAGHARRDAADARQHDLARARRNLRTQRLDNLPRRSVGGQAIGPARTRTLGRDHLQAGKPIAHRQQTPNRRKKIQDHIAPFP